MTLDSIAPNFGQGGAKLTEQGPGGLKSILTHLSADLTTAAEGVASLTSGLATANGNIAVLQGLTFSVVSGAAADTGITLTGVAATDELAFVLGLDPDNSTPASQVVDFTAAFAISGANTIKAAAQDTSGYDLVVVWYDKP